MGAGIPYSVGYSLYTPRTTSERSPVSVESAATALKEAVEIARAIKEKKARELAIAHAFAAMDRLCDELEVTESRHGLRHNEVFDY